MKNKYTIIDNFDKFDLGAIGEDGGVYENYTEFGNFELFTGAPDFNEIIPGRNAYTFPPTAFKYPYTFTPFMEYIPDMLRYITGLKFFITKEGDLIYPPVTVEDGEFPAKSKFPKWLPETYGPFTTLEGIFGDASKMYFDILDVEDQIDNNSSWFQNSLKFSDYYNFTVATEESGIAPDYLLNGEKLPTIRETLKEFRNPNSFNNGLNNTFYTPANEMDLIRNYMLFSADYHDDLIGSALDNGELKYFPWVDTSPISKIMPQNFANIKTFTDVMQKLLLSKRMMQDPISGESVNNTSHLYFVTDLPRGTDAIPYIDHDNKESTPPINALDYITNSDVVLTDSTYNYYAEYSEDYPDNVVDELQLPNLYTYYSFQTKKSDYYKELINLGTSGLGNVKNLSVKQYYNTIANSSTEKIELPKDKAFPTATEIPTYYRYKTIIVDDKNFLNDANAVASLFPMYNKITIPSKESGFMNIMKENKLVDEFVTLLGNYFSSYGNPESSMHRFLIFDQGINSPYEHGKAHASSVGLQILNLQKMYSSGVAIGQYEKYFSPNKFVKFGFKKEKTIGYGEGNTPATISLYGVKNKILDYLESRKLSLYQIYEGEKCHSEPLLIEIAKFSHGQGWNPKKHIQSIFLPCLSSGEEISYFDTQVFYGDEYKYEIYIHSLIVGSKYFINRIDPDADQKQLETGYHNTGNGNPVPYLDIGKRKPGGTKNDLAAIIVRAPFQGTFSLDGYKKNVTQIGDSPPLAPEIVFYPYKDDEEKILVSLGINYGQANLYPMAVFEEDLEKIKKYQEAQKDPNLKSLGLVTYKTDDALGTYQIYRTTKKPSGWDAFVDANLKELDIRELSAYNDYILPNTDYYYFARVIDVHGNISNPSAVFYVRIIKEEGFPPYLINHVYSFSEAKKPPKYDKSFKKYLSIRLADGTRTLVNPEKEDKKTNHILNNSLAYNKANNQGQLKKYKIRITSKKTGRKIDLNLDFTNETNNFYLAAKQLPTTISDGSPAIPPDEPEVTVQKVVEKVEMENKQTKLGQPGTLPDSSQDPNKKTIKGTVKGEATEIKTTLW